MESIQLSDNRWGMPGKPGALERSFAVGPQSFLTYESDYPSSIWVRMNEPTPVVQLLWWSVDNPEEQPEVLPFSQDKEDQNLFTLELPGKRAGRFVAQVRYGNPKSNMVLDSGGYVRIQAAPPAADHLRMYTLIPRVSGPMSGWTDLLDHIKSMGFTHVHVIPVTPFDVSRSPYAARDLFGVEAEYVEPETDPIAAWEAVVDYMEEIGLGLVVDLVLNHVGINSVPAKHYPGWVYPDATEENGFKRAGWSDGTFWHKWEDLALLNYKHPHPPTRDGLWEYMTAYALRWSGYAARTGGMIRLDNLHSSDEAFMKHCLDSVRTLYPELRIFGELFDTPEGVRRLVRDYGLHYILATPWETRFVPELRGLLQMVHDSSDELKQLTPMVSHDSGSVAQEFGTHLATPPRYVASSLLGSGLTGLAQGAEYGVDKRLEFIGPPESAVYPGDRSYVEIITKINALVAEHRAFRGAGNIAWLDHGHDAILAGLRIDENTGDRFIVAGNFDTSHEQHVHLDISALIPDLPAELSIVNLLGEDDERVVYDGHMTLHLGPGGVYVARV